MSKGYLETSYVNCSGNKTIADDFLEKPILTTVSTISLVVYSPFMTVLLMVFSLIAQSCPPPPQSFSIRPPKYFMTPAKIHV